MVKIHSSSTLQHKTPKNTDSSARTGSHRYHKTPHKTANLEIHVEQMRLQHLETNCVIRRTLVHVQQIGRSFTFESIGHRFFMCLRVF